MSTVPTVPKLFGAGGAGFAKPRSASGSSAQGVSTRGPNVTADLAYLAQLAQTLPNAARTGNTPQRPQSARLFNASQGGHQGGSSSTRTIDIDSADVLLTQTQRNLERTLREKHDLERTVMRLEGTISELRSEMERVAQAAVSVTSTPRNGGRSRRSAPARSSERDDDDDGERQEGEQPPVGYDPELLSAVCAAGDLLSCMFDNAPSPDEPVEVIHFLTDRVNELQAMEQKCEAIEKRRADTIAEVRKMTQEWEAKEKAVENELKAAKAKSAELASAQAMIADLKEQCKLLENKVTVAEASAAKAASRPTLSTEPVHTATSTAPTPTGSPTKPLSEQLRIGEIIDSIKAASNQIRSALDGNIEEDGETEVDRFIELFEKGERDTHQLLHDMRVAHEHFARERLLIKSVHHHAPGSRSATPEARQSSSEVLQLEQELRHHRQVNEDLNQQLDALREDCNAAEVRRAQADALASQLKTSLAVSEGELENIRSRLLEENQQRKDAELKVQDLASKLAAAEAAKAKVEKDLTTSFSDKLSFLESQVVRLEKDKKEGGAALDQNSKAREAHIKELTERVAKLESELKTSTAQLEEEAKITVELRQQLSAGRQELQADVDRLQQLVDGIQQIFGEELDESLLHRLSVLHENSGPEVRWDDFLDPSLELPPRVTDMGDPSVWTFDTIQRARQLPGGPLYQVGYNVAVQLKFFEDGLVEEDSWRRFLLALQDGYHDVPYHNATHAADITHAVNALLKMTGIGEKIPKVERFAIIAAAAGHDYDHPGRNNAFLMKTSHRLALRYNDQGILESHHAASTSALARKFGITSKLSAPDALRFREIVTKAILGTDMAVHFKHLGEVSKRLDAGPFDLEKPADRLEVLCMLLHSADVGNPTKVRHIAAQWAERVTAEFHDQGRDEQGRGMPFSFGCDPSVTNIGPSQIGFYDNIILPLFYTLARISPAIEELIGNVLENRKYYGGMCEKPPGPPPNRPAPQPPAPQPAPAAAPAAAAPAGNAQLEATIIEYQNLCKKLATENIALADKAAALISRLKTAEQGINGHTGNVVSDPKIDILVLSGPAGVGKGTLVDLLKQHFPEKFVTSVSHTTRAPRAGEKNGVQYHFVSKDEFKRMIDKDEFVEYAEVHGNLYGTSKAALRQANSSAAGNKGGTVILQLDVQGAKAVREKFEQSKEFAAVFLFVAAPSLEALKSRMEGRGKDSAEQVATRLKTAEKELKFVEANPQVFDRVIENNDLDQTFARLRRLLKMFKILS